MGPDKTPALKTSEVQKIIREILEKKLAGSNYETADSSHMTKTLAEQINERIKIIVPKRYKLVTFVVLGCREGCDLNVGSRCLWDPRFDQFHEEKYENSSVYAIVTVYVMYTE
ncbi:dynein light chain Tctex-type 5-B [Octopus bimaculoides]|uniref:Uncharacterized protein n=1 Tax=Octopus bimaculoides TaxID=37653 RepID=A0A0L8GIG9_OCTBM|nr:dynein light chain Tctex-type 5-B [Octopus bimaculoides]